MRRALGLFVAAAATTGCGFRSSAAPKDDAFKDDAPKDDAPVDVPDASESPYWVMAAVSHASGVPAVAAHPFDGIRFTAACPEQPGQSGSFPIRDLLTHPAQPLVYEVETGFNALSIGCSTITATGMANVGGPRPVQQIAFDTTRNVGFFTADGPLAIGLYRFTAAEDGAPTVMESTNTPSSGGALVLDAAAAQLYVAGAGIIGAYALSGPTLVLPPTTAIPVFTSAASCVMPVKLLRTGSYVLELCADSSMIRRYTTTPFVSDGMVGDLGAVDAAVALPGDRAVVARHSPPDLTVLALGAGTPTWTGGPSLASPVTAMSASLDGTLVATARSIDPNTSELALWRVTASSLTLVDTQQVAGFVTALALTAPGN